jgi:hypothetical protein
VVVGATANAERKLVGREEALAPQDQGAGQRPTPQQAAELQPSGLNTTPLRSRLSQNPAHEAVRQIVVQAEWAIAACVFPT